MESCQREILNHVIPLNEPHLRRLIRNYMNYHHEDRIHDSPKQRYAHLQIGQARAFGESNRNFDAAPGRTTS